MNLGACEGCYRDKSFYEFLDMQCNWKIDQKSSFFKSLVKLKSSITLVI